MNCNVLSKEIYKTLVAVKEKKIYNETMEKNKDKQQAVSLTSIRINKYLSEAGICSRREADRLIQSGRVSVNGRVVCPGDRVMDGEEVYVDGKRAVKEERRVLLLFHKPRGIVCSTKQQRDETTVTDYLDYPLRIYPVGRLDKESEGLLLMTNQGDLVNRIMRAGNKHEKEYVVTVNKPVTREFLEKMASGVPILHTVTRPCIVEQMGRMTFRIILTQGLNRQIRRMCEYFGYEVTSLKRVRIMNLKLEGIQEGKYREITSKEWKELSKMLESSSSETIIETGGYHGNRDISAANEKTGGKAESGSKGILSGRSGDHEQSGVRRPVRSAGGSGKGNRNRPGRKPNHQRRV